MKEFAVGVLYALVATFGFALVFQVDLRHLPWAALGGAVEWATYLVAFHFWNDVFLATLIASAVATFYSETCASLRRTPATVFLLPSLIPLVPGGSLYYTMSYLISSDYSQAYNYGMSTVYVVLGIAGGVVTASLIVYAIRSVKAKKIK
ncbi:MAG: threonine/serine exporter family protein [Eubacteriales bacterium]|nr:threonine/serine exporter family protein [Eubacteriales bacterium]